MKTGEILNVCGSITKKESLVYLTGHIRANTTIAEADQPYSNYYGQIPKKPHPNSLFLFTEMEYTLEEALRFTQNIDICAEKKVNAASAIIYSANHRLPAIRIRNFPDYKHLVRLQECYEEQGVVFAKRKIPEPEPLIRVNKCFRLEDAGDGIYLDLDISNEGYITLPYYPELYEFEELLREIRNNSSCTLFDAALGGFILNGKVINIMRVYLGHLNLDLMKCIQEKTYKSIKATTKMRHLQGTE